MACKRHKPPLKPKPKPKPSPETCPAKPALPGPETQMKENSVASGGGVVRNNSGKKKKISGVGEKKLVAVANDGGVIPNKLKIGEKKLNSVVNDRGISPSNSKRRRRNKSGSSSVGDEKKVISGKSDGEANQSNLKRKESSVGEKQWKSVSNEGNNLKKIRVGGKKLISGKNDGGKCSVSVKNTTSELNGCGNDTTSTPKNRRSRRGKKKEKSSVCEANDGGVNNDNSIAKVDGGKKSCNGEQKSVSVGKKDSSLIAKAVGGRKNGDGVQNTGNVGKKKWSLIAKVDDGKENKTSEQKIDNVGKKSSSLIAKVDDGKENKTSEQKIDNVGKKDSSLIAKVVGGKKNLNGEQKIDNVGKKKPSLIVDGGKNYGNASGRIRVGKLKTVGRVGKKVNSKVKEGSGEKQQKKKRIGGRKPILQAKKKGGMKSYNLNDLGLWDENEKMLREALRRIGEGKRVEMKKAYLKAYMLRLDVMQVAAQKALDGLKADNLEVKLCGEDYPYSVEENPCFFDWKDQVLGMIARRMRLRDELQADISWCPPKVGVLKWNTDASFREDSGMAAIGGVLRDWNGSLRCVFSCPIECWDSNEAELRAIYKALELASKKDWLLSLQVIIESDSMNAVTWCNDHKGGPANYGYMLNFIRECRLWWPGLQITYMGRKSNSVVDRLAKQAHQRTADFIHWV